MNRHFTDAAYYARRTAEATHDGLREELHPVIERAQAYRGDDPAAPEPRTRIEELQAELDELEARAEAEARDAIRHARGRLESLRSAQ